MYVSRALRAAARWSLLLGLVSVLAPRLALAEELTGAAILEHPCGKVSVEHMALIHDGKIAEAVQLATPEMQKEWAEMAADERDMISEMMKELSMSREDYVAAIGSGGKLVIEDSAATLTVSTEESSSQGTSHQTITQHLVLAGDDCMVTRGGGSDES